MKRWEVSVLLAELLIVVMLAMGVVSLVGAKLGKIFSTINSGNAYEYAVAISTRDAVETVVAARSPVLVEV